MTEEIRNKIKLNAKFGVQLTTTEFEKVKEAFHSGDTHVRAIYADTDSVKIVSKDNALCMYDHIEELVGEGYGHIQPNVDDDLFI